VAIDLIGETALAPMLSFQNLSTLLAEDILILADRLVGQFVTQVWA